MPEPPPGLGSSAWVEVVRYGDVLSLQGQDPEFFVRADATSGQVAAAVNDRDMPSCLWRVVPALEYGKLEAWGKRRGAKVAASRHSMLKILEDLGVRDEPPRSKAPEALLEHLEVLHVRREAKRNVHALANTLDDAGSARARDLMFYEKFQLQHVRTGFMLAAADDGALMLHAGSAGCCFYVAPDAAASDAVRRAPVSYNDATGLFAVPPEGATATTRGKRRASLSAGDLGAGASFRRRLPVSFGRNSLGVLCPRGGDAY